MTALLLLIPVSVFLGLLGLGAFVWSLKHDQYRDLEGDGARILFNEDEPDAHLREDRDDAEGETEVAARR